MNQKLYTKHEVFHSNDHGYIITMRLHKYTGEELGHCKISSEDKSWTISEWFIHSDYQNRGLGKRLLFQTVEAFSCFIGNPIEVKYIWNGENRYVFHWLTTHFDPISTCPIAVQKMLEESGIDDYSSHIYKLNTKQFIEYFQMPTEKLQELECSR